MDRALRTRDGCLVRLRRDYFSIERRGARSIYDFLKRSAHFADGIRDDLEFVVSGGKIAGIRNAARSASRWRLILAEIISRPDSSICIFTARRRPRHDGGVVAKPFRRFAHYHASGGTTSLLLTTATAPMARHHCRCCARCSDSRAMSQLPQIAGVHVEGPFISRERRGRADARNSFAIPTRNQSSALLEFRGCY